MLFKGRKEGRNTYRRQPLAVEPSLGAKFGQDTTKADSLPDLYYCILFDGRASVGVVRSHKSSA